jgi:hypothetical protein
VNVTWRGKTYVGTLLDCTKHDWAPPRFCDSPTSDYDCKGTKNGRSKQTRASSTVQDTRIFHSKLRNGKRRRNQFIVPPLPVKMDSFASKRTTRNSKDAAESRLDTVIRENLEANDCQKVALVRSDPAESAVLPDDLENDVKAEPSSEGEESHAAADLEDQNTDDTLTDSQSNPKLEAIDHNLPSSEQTYESSAQSPAYSDISDANDVDDDEHHSNSEDRLTTSENTDVLPKFGIMSSHSPCPKQLPSASGQFSFFPANEASSGESDIKLATTDDKQVKLESNAFNFSSVASLPPQLPAPPTPHSISTTSAPMTFGSSSHSLSTVPPVSAASASTAFPYPSMMSGFPFSMDPALHVHPMASDSNYKINFENKEPTRMLGDKMRFKQEPPSFDIQNPLEAGHGNPLSVPPKAASPYDFNSYEKQRQQEELIRQSRPEAPGAGLFGVLKSECNKSGASAYRSGSEMKPLKEEPIKPTMETTGPPPPPTNSYYLPQSFLPHPSGAPGSFMPAGPFDPFLGNFRHPLRFPPMNHLQGDLSALRPPGDLPVGGSGHMLAPSGSPSLQSAQNKHLALDMLHKASQQYNHKMHELQERALISPKSNGGGGKLGNAQSLPSPSSVPTTSGPKKDDARSPPPQRHLHTHHHTHVGVAYPIYDPYGGKF